MIARPCNISARCNPCAEDSSPYENLSAEAPDPINFIANAFVNAYPKENGAPDEFNPPAVVPTCPWCITGVVGKGTGTTQQQANTGATNNAKEQVNDAQGKPTFWNAAYGGNIPCPGGGSSQYDIPAGTYSGNSQAEADALAQSNFDQLAYANLICITTTSVPSACASDTDYDQTLSAYGGITEELGHYVWEVSAGSLPPGFALDAISGLINGAPNTSVPGTYDFTVTVSDDLSNNASKDFSISIVSISPTATDLTDATNGTSYSQQLTIDPPTLTGTFSITGGTLPTGLSMDATGLISGTPSVGGAFSITVSVSVESLGLVCSKTYTLNCWSFVDVTSNLTQSNTSDTTITTATVYGIGTYKLMYSPMSAPSDASDPIKYVEHTGGVFQNVASLGGNLGDCPNAEIIQLVGIGDLKGYTMKDPASGAVAVARCDAAMAAEDSLLTFSLAAPQTLTFKWPQYSHAMCESTASSMSGGHGIHIRVYRLA